MLKKLYFCRLVKPEDTEVAGTIFTVVMGFMMLMGSALSPLFVMLWGPHIENQ